MKLNEHIKLTFHCQFPIQIMCYYNSLDVRCMQIWICEYPLLTLNQGSLKLIFLEAKISIRFFRKLSSRSVGGTIGGNLWGRFSSFCFFCFWKKKFLSFCSKSFVYFDRKIENYLDILVFVKSSKNKMQ